MDEQILMVDDYPEALSLQRMILHRGGFHNLLEAANADIALALLNEYCPDLILLDDMLPGMHGLELCRVIRERDDIRHIPILMIVATIDERRISRCFEAGATDLLRKPFLADEFLRRVHTLLGHSGSL